MHAGIELNFVEFKVSKRLFGFGGVLSIVLLTASLSSSFDGELEISFPTGSLDASMCGGDGRARMLLA